MSRPVSTHACHARSCAIRVSSHIFMCKRHWYMVPAPLRKALREAWRDKRHQDWIEASDAAIAAVAAKEAAA